MFQSGIWVEQWYLDPDLFVTGAVGTGVPYVDNSRQILYCGDANPLYLSGTSLVGNYLENPLWYTGDVLYFQGADVLISGDTIVF
ncbi:MAG: hypothetical protein GXP45_07355 [bacterium]|nr:hypothetical protein [bacterium]